MVATLREPTPASPLAGRDNILIARLDVEDAHSIDGAVNAGIARFGAIDALVNNAGYGQFGLFEALTEAQIQRQFAVNVFGVTETRFSERQAREQAVAATLTDYAPFIDRTQRAFAAMGAARSISALDVAKVIHQAATDGSDRLRYLIGDDSRGFISARRELPEGDYIAFMRGRFR